MQNREQFLLDRKQGIGGSDVAAIMGLSPWRTALDVYNDKLSPVNLDEDVHEDLRRGVRAERYILEEYAENTGEILLSNIPTFIDNEYPFMRGNVDAKLKNHNVVVEAKSTKASISSWDNGIPEHYKLQVAYYAMLADADRVDVAVLFSGWRYGCYTYWRDAELEQQIKTVVINFWQKHILKNIPPAPQSLAELQAAYPVINTTTTIKADENIRHVVAELQEVSVKRKELESKEKRLKQNIQQYMGEAGLLDAGFCKVALKNRCVNRLDSSALKLANPEIYQNYLQETQYRILQFIGG